jgi:stage V sporulation protein AC
MAGGEYMTDQERELLRRHQEILVREAGSRGEERVRWAEKRKEIEKAQDMLLRERGRLYLVRSNKTAPKVPLVKNMLWAFGVGGLICMIGQGFVFLFRHFGLAPKEASTAGTCVLIVLGALLTGLGVYDGIGKRAGAGSIVPVTGFSNSISSAALEFKREGFLYGVGARIFTVAGPVILYGVSVSILVGLIHLLF